MQVKYGAECAVSKGFYISFVLAGNLLSSFFILNVFLYLPEGCGSLFITKSIDQSAGRDLIFNITAEFLGSLAALEKNQVAMLVPLYLSPKSKSIA